MHSLQDVVVRSQDLAQVALGDAHPLLPKRTAQLLRSYPPQPLWRRPCAAASSALGTAACSGRLRLVRRGSRAGRIASCVSHGSAGCLAAHPQHAGRQGKARPAQVSCYCCCLLLYVSCRGKVDKAGALRFFLIDNRRIWFSACFDRNLPNGKFA